MRAGQLRHRVTFRRRQTSNDDMGNYLTNWADLFVDVPSMVKPVRGGEMTVHEKLRGTGVVEVWVRSNSETSTVNADDMLVHDGVDFNIRYVEPIDYKGRYLKMVCERGVASG